MYQKPANEAARNEPVGAPAPQADGAEFRIKCTHAIDGSFAGWLDYSGPGNWVYLTGNEGTPGGMKFQLYINKGVTYLNPVGTYVGNPRYLGPGNADSQAGWYYWANAVGISWDGVHMIQMLNTPAQHLYDYGKGWVYWGTGTDTAMNCQRI
jgi:hypothetical protein